jgi:hypothetical protein
MNNLFFFLILVIFTLNATGQNICSLKDNVEFLHVNNVRAAISNRGTNFANSSKASFNVPYTSSATPSSIYSTSLWFGGYDIDGNLCTNTMMYKSAEDCGYIPGPFIEGFDEKDYDMANNWNKIFKVTGEEILAHIADYNDHQINNAIESIYGWPGKGNSFFKGIHGFDLYEATHAGFHETMGHINGIYEPHFGEYPKVEGLSDNSIPGAIFWCVYRGGVIYDGTGSPYDKSMKLQIEQTSWAMSCDNDILSNALFTRYLVTNKSDGPYFNFRFGLFTDPDLGCLDDDYVGSFPDLSSFYVYNMDNEDGPDCVRGIKTYGINPPVQVITFLGENGLDGFIFDSVYNRYYKQENYYNQLNCKFHDGSPITHGGNGNNPGSTDTVFYMFPDIPTNPDGWSMITAGTQAGDKRVLGISRLKHNPDFVFNPGQSIKFDIAYTYFRKEGYSNLENVLFAQSNIPHLHELFKKGLPECSSPVCNCNCVWPGDTDKNGIVNYSDYVNILKNLSRTGPNRNHPVAWIGQEVLDWPLNANTVVNPKYADANGDGTIDTLDLTVVDDLVGTKNLCFTSVENFCDEGDELFWKYNMTDSVLMKNQIVQTELILKNENNLLGLEYEIKFDGNIFNTYSEKNEISWENISANTLFYIKTSYIGEIPTYFTVNYEIIKNIIQFNDKKINTRLSDQNNNRIFNLNLYINKIPSKYPTPYTRIKVCNAIAHYEDGTIKHLPSQTLNLKLPDNVVITGIENPTDKQSDIQIMVSPNPANTEINISFGTLVSGEIKIDILDMSGRCIYSRLIDNFNQNIDVSSLSQGIYYLRLINDQFIKTEKVVICR